MFVNEFFVCMLGYYVCPTSNLNIERTDFPKQKEKKTLAYLYKYRTQLITLAFQNRNEQQITSTDVCVCVLVYRAHYADTTKFSFCVCLFCAKLNRDLTAFAAKQHKIVLAVRFHSFLAFLFSPKD